jgi:hypothetical protein
MMILPRQARDKHRENTQKCCRTRQQQAQQQEQEEEEEEEERPRQHRWARMAER